MRLDSLTKYKEFNVTASRSCLELPVTAVANRVAFSTKARDALYDEYADLIKVNSDLDRSLVSFQANKREPFYGWFKYKEGFASRLVAYFIKHLADSPGVLLDPFAGAGASLFASAALGWDAIGIELLPVVFYIMDVRQSVTRVKPEKFSQMIKQVSAVRFGELATPEYAFKHIPITEGAFSGQTEKEMAGYLRYCEKEIRDPHIRSLFRFACFAVLEEISYTRKDGQYLRWDRRSTKVRSKVGFDKGTIHPFRRAVLQKLSKMSDDLMFWREGWCRDKKIGTVDIRQGSCLELLPQMPVNSVDLVITSPPYCNRYDYTRTYALELAFLERGADDVKNLRQAMLSCTVENKEKVEMLRQIYANRRRLNAFEKVQHVFDSQEALQEVLDALDHCREHEMLNNSNVPRMVRNYFYEMCFVVFELARVLRPGGKIVMVNDNVRYAGEEVPVDLILSDFARTFGLKVRHIWTLPRGKGNSSQQMGSHGRQELRKCVYIWER